MKGIKAYCNNGKVMRVYIGRKDTCSEEERIEFEKEGSAECKDLEKLLKKSWMGEDVDFSQYLDLEYVKYN